MLLANKMSICSLSLAFRSRASGQCLQKPRHVVPQRTHCLQALGVLLHIAGHATEDIVPVLRGYDGHIGNLEILVQALHSADRAAATAYPHRCAGFILEIASE